MQGCISPANPTRPCTLRPVLDSQPGQLPKNTRMHLPWHAPIPPIYAHCGRYSTPSQSTSQKIQGCTFPGMHQSHHTLRPVLNSQARQLGSKTSCQPPQPGTLCPLLLLLPFLLCLLPLFPGVLPRSFILNLGRPAALRHALANKMQVVHVDGVHHHPLGHYNQPGLRERPLTSRRRRLHAHARQCCKRVPSTRQATVTIHGW